MGNSLLAIEPKNKDTIFDGFLFNAYREFVERSARLTPIVAVFEDLHWADEPTLLLLKHLAQTVATIPVLMIGTYRDVELDAVP